MTHFDVILLKKQFRVDVSWAARELYICCDIKTGVTQNQLFEKFVLFPKLQVLKSYYKFFWTIRICITTDNSHIRQLLVTVELLPPLLEEVRTLYLATQTGQSHDPEVSIGVLLTLSFPERRILYMVTSLWSNIQRSLGKRQRISALESCGDAAYAIQSNPLKPPGNILALHIPLNHSLV